MTKYPIGLIQKYFTYSLVGDTMIVLTVDVTTNADKSTQFSTTLKDTSVKEFKFFTIAEEISKSFIRPTEKSIYLRIQ